MIFKFNVQRSYGSHSSQNETTLFAEFLEHFFYFFKFFLYSIVSEQSYCEEYNISNNSKNPHHQSYHSIKEQIHCKNSPNLEYWLLINALQLPECCLTDFKTDALLSFYQPFQNNTLDLSSHLFYRRRRFLIYKTFGFIFWSIKNTQLKRICRLLYDFFGSSRDLFTLEGELTIHSKHRKSKEDTGYCRKNVTTTGKIHNPINLPYFGEIAS